MTLRWGPVAFVVAGAVGGALPAFASDYAMGFGLNLAMWIALAESWVLFSGLTGYVSLGHAVFFGLGSFILAIGWKSIPPVASLGLAGAGSVLLALAVGVPCLRVRGPYFVMLSFGLAEFVKYAVVDIEARLGSGSRIILGAPDLRTLYWMMLGLALAAFGLTWWARRSRFGAALRAIREDETAAETIGIHTSLYKSGAFGLSAAIPGMVGAVMCMRGGFFEPHPAFDPLISLTMICIAVVGGSDSAAGPLLGAVLLVGMSELLWAEFPHLYMVLVGSVLVVFVLVAPEGAVGRVAALTRWRNRTAAPSPDAEGHPGGGARDEPARTA
jgi:branched-chain amino acid transport system permease protein